MDDSVLLQQLQQFYEEDPEDPFNIYGLALAFTKSNIEKASFYFDLLLNNHPEYLPAYYQAGKLFSESGEPEKALDIYCKGMALAQAQGNRKTYEELKRADRALRDDLEEW